MGRWDVRFYKDETGREPAKDFLVKDLTNVERTRFVKRMQYLQQQGLRLVAKRPDILKKVQGERDLFRLSMTKSQNNPRFLLCARSGRRLIVLHGFKEKSASDYDRALATAAERRDKLEARDS